MTMRIREGGGLGTRSLRRQPSDALLAMTKGNGPQTASRRTNMALWKNLSL